MRELHGVFRLNRRNAPKLKRYALLFDRFHVVEIYEDFDPADRDPQSPAARADLNFLESKGIVIYDVKQFVRHGVSNRGKGRDFAPAMHLNGTDRIIKLPWAPHGAYLTDLIVRQTAIRFKDLFNLDCVPICKRPLPINLVAGPREKTELVQVLNVAVKSFPTPDDSCSWADLIAFKSESHDKQWGFRRFLFSLANKELNEAEIRDEIEWMFNEYSKAMRVYGMKASQSSVQVFLISPLEIIENLLKLNLSKIAEGILSVKKRRIELLEAEMKAPGRECAYVFDARKRFGGLR
jgi:hypothetical protein